MKSFDKISFQKKKGHSHKIMAELLVNNKENYFDLVYVDGSHTADDVIFDACFAFKLCRPGGIIIFDDYLWPVVKKLPLEKKPKMAIDAFTNIFHDKITIIQKSLYQLYVVKNLEEKTHKKTH
jgi:predicted O-methyltransferase YrrM